MEEQKEMKMNKEVTKPVEVTKPEDFGNEKVNLADITPMESQGFDFWEYDKKEITIDDAVIMKVKSQFNDTGFQWVLKIQSEVLETYGEGEDKIEFRASELFNLIQDKEGKLIGFPTGDASNLVKFLKDIGIRDITKFKNLQEIVEVVKGKKTLVKAYDRDYQGGSRTYLKFRY